MQPTRPPRWSSRRRFGFDSESVKLTQVPIELQPMQSCTVCFCAIALLVSQLVTSELRYFKVIIGAKRKNKLVTTIILPHF